MSTMTMANGKANMPVQGAGDRDGAPTGSKAQREHARRFFALAAQLLDYPDAAWHADLKQVVAEAQSIGDARLERAVLRFARAAQEADEKAFEARYVELFDFSNKTSLFLTSRSRADGAAQRMDLIGYSVYFREAGYQVEGDTPDNLVAVLELAGELGDEALARLCRHMGDDLQLLDDALKDAHVDDYGSLVHAVRAAARSCEGKVVE